MREKKENAVGTEQLDSKDEFKAMLIGLVLGSLLFVGAMKYMIVKQFGK